MEKRILFKIFPWLLVFLIILLGCQAIPNSYAGQIAKVQKSVPFTILMPTYFPPNMSDLTLLITGPDKGPYPDFTWISLTFFKPGQNNIIIIDQVNHIVNQIPGDRPFDNFSINGTTVIEINNPIQIPPSNSTLSRATIVDGYVYGWNQNGINFQVEVSGTDTNNYRKMVESIIKQK